MKELKEAIRTRGKAINKDILLVDSFLNHQVDPMLMHGVGEAFADHFKDMNVERVLTIESSGIAPAAFTAYKLGVPLVIMKKHLPGKERAMNFTSLKCNHDYAYQVAHVPGIV